MDAQNDIRKISVGCLILCSGALLGTVLGALLDPANIQLRAGLSFLCIFGMALGLKAMRIARNEAVPCGLAKAGLLVGLVNMVVDVMTTAPG